MVDTKQLLLLLLCFRFRKVSAFLFVPSIPKGSLVASSTFVPRQRGAVTAAVSSSARDSPVTTTEPHYSLTVVIPAYNEQDRIAPTLLSYVQYLRQRDRSRWKGTASILVVDDGSTDGTSDTVRKMAATIAAENNGRSGDRVSQQRCPVACLVLPRNQGKGAALAAGIAHVAAATIAAAESAASSNHSPTNRCCSLILTADADGSADVESLERLMDVMRVCLRQQQTSTTTSGNSTAVPGNGTRPPRAVVCGYRTYDDTATGRRIFRWGFRTTVHTVCGSLSTRDTQCGFKLMTAVAAHELYQNLHLTGWSHDVEVLYRAKLLGVPVLEAPVRWNDKDGSKLTAEGVLKVAARMLFDVCLCRLAYAMGWWNVEDHDHNVAI